MSLSTLPRPVSAPSRVRHEHTRQCWWNHLECRWECASHGSTAPRVPAPRPASED